MEQGAMQDDQEYTEGSIVEMRLIGGLACLDFSNTLDGRGGPDLIEYLSDYRDLVLWCQHAQILSKDEAQRLCNRAESQPTAAQAVFAQAVTLRECIYRIFSAIIDGGQPLAGDLTILNTALTEALSHARINPQFSNTGFAWDWTAADALERPLWPIVRSMADVLTSPKLMLVRKCQGINCGWIFLDISKNQRRQWCRMDTCGNRAKARRHYARHKTDE